MKTRAAVLRKGGTPWEIPELELDPPRANEVLIRMEAAGLCHSDEHTRARGTARLPLVGGHEGSGVVVEVGPGVTRVPDQTFRFHRGGEDFGGICVVGSFAEYSVLSEWSCVKIGGHDRHHRRRLLRHGAAGRHP